MLWSATVTLLECNHFIKAGVNRNRSHSIILGVLDEMRGQPYTITSYKIHIVKSCLL